VILRKTVCFLRLHVEYGYDEDVVGMRRKLSYRNLPRLAFFWKILWYVSLSDIFYGEG